MKNTIPAIVVIFTSFPSLDLLLVPLHALLEPPDIEPDSPYDLLSWKMIARIRITLIIDIIIVNIR